MVRDTVELNLSGIGGKSRDVRFGCLKGVLVSESKQVPVITHILKQLTNWVPNRPSRVPLAAKSIKLADPENIVSKPVDMISVADVFEALMGSQQRELSPGMFARRTIFGWVLVRKQKQTLNSFVCCHFSEDEALRKFWEIKSMPQKNFYTEEEINCEKFFNVTTKFENDRLVVKLHSKKDAILGDSFNQAKRGSIP